MPKIVLTGGGTAGHITPSIALLPELVKSGFQIDYIGLANSMEEKLMKEEGISFHAISGGKLRRYFSFKNFLDVFKIILGIFQAIVLLLKLKPDVVFSKGGFVSCPVVWAAGLLRIPVVIHESDISPGLANRLALPFAQKICYAFPETINYLPQTKAVKTGIPIRNNLFAGDKAKGLELCHFTDSKPVILIMGGSQGAGSINQKIRDNLTELLEKYQICHICGKGNLAANCKNLNGYAQFEYVNQELPHLFAITDLIISRAGATSLFEIAALKKLNILIPLSAKVSRGDQILNANSFAKQGLSRLISEEELQSVSIVDVLSEVFEDRQKYFNALEQVSATDSVRAVIEVIEEAISDKFINGR